MCTRQCHFLTWCFVVQYSLWISMCNWVWKMPRTVIFSKIASVILDKQKSEDSLSEDFLSILNPSEITKLLWKKDQNKSSNYNVDRKHIENCSWNVIFWKFHSIACVFEWVDIHSFLIMSKFHLKVRFWF